MLVLPEVPFTPLINLVSRKDFRAKEEEEEGIITFRPVINDSGKESMILLTGLKNIFQKQLPNMPKEYIARLVYDKNHRSMAIVKKNLNVVGGITYKLFKDQHFAEASLLCNNISGICLCNTFCVIFFV